MKKRKSTTLISAIAVFISMIGGVSADVLLNDGFGPSISQQTNINYGIPGRQIGSLQPINWSKSTRYSLQGFLQDDGDPGATDLHLLGVSVGDWYYARGWASPDQDWIGWNDIKFSVDIDPVSFNGTNGYCGLFIGGSTQGWGCGPIELQLNKAGDYNVVHSGTTIATGTGKSGWHNWAAEVKKIGEKHVVSVSCDGSTIVPEHNVGTLSSNYVTLSHVYSPNPGDWSTTGSKFDNFIAESIAVPDDETCLFLDDFTTPTNTTSINTNYDTRQAGTLSPASWATMEDANYHGYVMIDGSPARFLNMQALSYYSGGGIPYDRYSWASPNIDFINNKAIRLSFDMQTGTVHPAGSGDIWAGCNLGGNQGLYGGGLAFSIYNDYDDSGNLLSAHYIVGDSGVQLATGSVDDGWHHVVFDLKQWGPYYVFSVTLDGTPIVTDRIAGTSIGAHDYINFTNQYEKTGWTYSRSSFDNVKVIEINVPQTDAPAYIQSRGTLLEKGLQLTACTIDPYAFSLARYEESGFNGVDLGWGLDPSSNISALGSAPGIPWSFWTMEWWLTPDATVSPYMSNLTFMQCNDEQNLFSTDPEDYSTLPAVTTVFAQWRALYPNVISRTNQYGGQITTEQLRQYVQTARPGMIIFDKYSFNGLLTGGSPTTLYKYMQQYRTIGLEGYDGSGTYPIPYGMYFQTMKVNGHTPSESEMRLQQFASWAFGYTVLEAFLYSNSSNVESGLFNGSGDTTPTPAFYYTAAANLESRKLGDALVRLVSNGLWMQMGTGNPLPESISSYSSGNVPYLTNVSATNNGTLNGGNSGDVIIGKFKLLDESIDGSSHTGETYFMITNGLCDPNGTAAQTQQTIRLSFDFSTSGITGLQRISRTTGLVENVPLVHDSGSIYHLDLVLPGGTGDLFKFNTGAKFVGEAASPISIVDAKGSVDGQSVACSGTITYASTNYFYIEKADRTSGIRVVKANHGKSVGQGVTVVGTLTTDANGERYIQASTISAGNAENVLPLGTTNKALGGGNLNYSYDSSSSKTLSGQKGVTDGTGLNNIGLLMKAWGQASSADSEGFVLSDGSGVSVKVIVASPSLYDGKYVSVTGVNSMENGQRVIFATQVKIEN